MRRLCPAALAALFLACSQTSLSPQVAPGGRLADEGRPAAERTLYRVRYAGPKDNGSLRLVLRRLAAERFQLQASDAFGRAVWSLDVDGDEVLLVDHRRRQACVSGRDLRVPEVALRPLPLPAVARVLDSRTPLPPPPGADRADWTDEEGQRWTARWEGELLTAWTLWQSGEPQLWWSRQPRGGILSHRDGSQFRWHRVAREEFLPAEYRPLEPPAEYRFGECRLEGDR
jgi:hypothetical protein